MFKCTCCDAYTLPVPADSALAFICPVCRWENDVFIKSDDEQSDENRGLTLTQARQNYKDYGASRKDLIELSRPPMPEEMQIAERKKQ